METIRSRSSPLLDILAGRVGRPPLRIIVKFIIIHKIMFAVKFEMDGQNVKKTYSHEVFTDSRHKTREEAEKVVRGYYRDFMNDGPDGRTRIEGTDTDFTVISNNPEARITGTLHFYIEEED